MSRAPLALALVAGAITGAVSCAPDFDPPSELHGLRVLAVSAEPVYALPGESVELALSYHDALGAEPREVEVSWLAGCFNPPGGHYQGCYAALANATVQQERIAPDQSGVPGAVRFSFTIPDDVLEAAPQAESGTTFATGYVFFTLCAGHVAPAPPSAPGTASFPLVCVDEAGQRLGADSFVPGYIQVYAFADGRRNASPPVDGMTLNGAAFDPAADPPRATPCPLTAEERDETGCGAQDPLEVCTTYTIDALIQDVAEVDPEQTGPEGDPLREVVWVNYYADRGTFDGPTQLVSDATNGYRAEHPTIWIPPPEPGPVNFWAVARDARGGASVSRMQVIVE